MGEFCIVKQEKQIIQLRNRDSHIAVGIIEKMDTSGLFDNEERAYFCFIESHYLASRTIKK